MAAGQPYDIAPIAPNVIRSVEGGLLSYVSDITRDDNPFVLGFDWMIDFDQELDFIGKAALQTIKADGPKRRLVGVELQGDLPEGSNGDLWEVERDGKSTGHITRIVRSPRLEKNIGFANVRVEDAASGTELTTQTPSGEKQLTVCEWPWFPAQKNIPKKL
jgi:aminomethyltransferase